MFRVFLWFILSGEEDPAFRRVMHHRELAGLGAFLPLDCVLTSETFAFSVSSTAVQSNYHERQPAYLHSLGQAGRCHPGLC